MIKKNPLLWLLPLVILSMTQCRHETAEADHKEGYREEVKIYDKPTIEDDFDGSSVLVVMDKKTGGINKPHKTSFFGSFEMEYVKDLTEITRDIDSRKYLNKEQFHQILMIQLPKDSKENVLDVIRQLEKVEGILYASPNYYFYPATAPNDPKFTSGEQWGLNGPYGINAPAAWDITTGARGIQVGIIDSGVGPHPDLDANVLPGRNFEYNNSNTTDTDGHGTSVASIVGAVGNNGTDITGVSWEVGLVPLKVNSQGNNQIGIIASRVIQAISYAISNDIGILNCSQEIAFDFPNLTITTFNSLYHAIGIYNGLFVQAAGNEGRSIDSNGNASTWPYYVGLRQIDNVIIVGAIDSDGNRWVNSSSLGSNYGKNTVHLFAPGDNILTTILGDSYHSYPGTSLAAPHVAGAAALLMSVYPHLTAAQIKTIILDNVTKDSRLTDYCTTGGRLNVEKALKSQGTVVGFMDINYNNSYCGLSGVIGRFYLFTDGKWTFVQRGIRSSTQSLSSNYNVASYLQMGPVPATIANYLGNRIINTPVEVLIPSTDPRIGNHYAGVSANFRITSAGVTITHVNYSARPVGNADTYRYVLKIADRQGTL